MGLQVTSVTLYDWFVLLGICICWLGLESTDVCRAELQSLMDRKCEIITRTCSSVLLMTRLAAAANTSALNNSQTNKYLSDTVKERARVSNEGRGRRNAGCDIYGSSQLHVFELLLDPLIPVPAQLMLRAHVHGRMEPLYLRPLCFAIECAKFGIPVKIRGIVLLYSPLGTRSCQTQTACSSDATPQYSDDESQQTTIRHVRYGWVKNVFNGCWPKVSLLSSEHDLLTDLWRHVKDRVITKPSHTVAATNNTMAQNLSSTPGEHVPLADKGENNLFPTAHPNPLYVPIGNKNGNPKNINVDLPELSSAKNQGEASFEQWEIFSVIRPQLRQQLCCSSDGRDGSSFYSLNKLNTTTTTAAGSIHDQIDEENDVSATPRSTKPAAIKAITSQIKDMAVKASGACKPCTGSSNRGQANGGYADSEGGSGSDRFHIGYQRTGHSTPRVWGKEMEARLKGLSSGSSTPASYSDRIESVKFMEEDEVKEWVAQVEPGVLITFNSLPQGGNDLKRIRFRLTYCKSLSVAIMMKEQIHMFAAAGITCREMFNKRQAQRWWAENCDKVMELYNVQRFNHQGVPQGPQQGPQPAPSRSEDEKSSKIESFGNSPVTPPLIKEPPPRNFYPKQPPNDSSGLASTPALSSISGAKTETSSMASARSSSSREDDHSGELSMSNASDVETEWVEQDEPGVYITIRALPGGNRELRRVRFSREKFGEMNARMWWEQNRARIQEQYL
ncbi:Brevis radix-like protein 2 [Tanacetum coccineum]